MIQRLARFPTEIFGRQEYRVLGIPAVFCSPIDQLAADATDLRPFGHCEAAPSALQKYACTLVSGLLCFGCPVAVVRTVRAVIISALNRVCWCRGQPHIRQKDVELTPSFTNINPPSAIIGEVLGGRVGAARPKALPSVVFLRRLLPAFTSRVAVPQVPSPVLLSIKAAAGFCVASLKGAGFDGCAISAIAKAKPRDAFADIFCTPNDSQAIKFLAGKINKLWHFVTSKWFTVRSAWRSAANRFSGATLAKQPNTTGCATW